MSLADDQTVRVNAAGLAEVAKALRTEIEQGLQSQLIDLVHAYNLGVTVGAGLPSPAVLRVREQYRQCLLRIIQQLDSFVMTGQVLADVADTIAQRYQHADAAAAFSIDELDSAFTAAYAVTHDPLGMPAAPDQPIRINGKLVR